MVVRALLLIVCVACSSPAPKPPAAPADPATSPLLHTWIVADHVLVKGASITPVDAAGFHGRTLDITAAGFMSPWQGSCAHATRTEHDRPLTEVISELGVVDDDRARVDAFGFVDAAVEYRLVCDDATKPIPLTILVGGDKAMTCYGGACYLMNRF